MVGPPKESKESITCASQLSIIIANIGDNQPVLTKGLLRLAILELSLNDQWAALL